MKRGGIQYLTRYLKLINKIKGKSSVLAKALDLKHISFTVADHNYIEEFLSCVKPLSQALDILQGGKSIFYGMILLCLLQKVRLTNCEHLKYCKLIRESLIHGIERRFSNILNLNVIESDKPLLPLFLIPS